MHGAQKASICNYGFAAMCVAVHASLRVHWAKGVPCLHLLAFAGCNGAWSPQVLSPGLARLSERAARATSVDCAAACINFSGCSSLELDHPGLSPWFRQVRLRREGICPISGLGRSTCVCMTYKSQSVVAYAPLMSPGEPRICPIHRRPSTSFGDFANMQL